MQTATPLATKAELEINNEIGPKDYEGLFDHIQSFHDDETVVVVGHANTVPEFINSLETSVKYEWLKEDEFDKIFVVKVYDDKVEASKLSYKPSNGHLAIISE